MCSRLVQVRMGTSRRRETAHFVLCLRQSVSFLHKSNITITSRVKSLSSFGEHPPDYTSDAPTGRTNVSTAADSCPACPLPAPFLENLFALPRRGEGASPPFWLLFSAPALSQHSVSSSQSPCQQDFTQWPGELQSVAQQHTHTCTRGTHHSFANTPPSPFWQAGQQTPLGYNVWKVTSGCTLDTVHYNIQPVNRWPTAWSW